jgi:uncharacterized protein (TIGR03435 family)
MPRPLLMVLLLGMLSQGSAQTKPSFEAAAVKPSISGDNRVAILGQPGGRFVATNATLKMLMGVAYRVRDFQISGGPSWVATERWNIEAKAEEGSIPPPTGLPDPTVPNPLMLMVQSLIEDRFQLKMHSETKELPVYELVIAKSGSKMKLSEDQSPFRPPERGSPPPSPPQRGGPTLRGSMRFGRGELEANGVPLFNFIQALSQPLGRPVIDKTGLKGLYDIQLQWTPELGQGPVVSGGPEPPPPPPDSSGPSIFNAIQEQLGLRLESAKGPVEIWVIDSVQKPTEN